MEIKQVIIVNKDLNMKKGKICSQVAHASLNSYLITSKKNKEIVEKWLNEGQKKIILKTSLKEILEIKKYFDEKGVPNVLIRDMGLTQVKKGDITCLGIGPWYEEEIDKKTKHLKLL